MKAMMKELEQLLGHIVQSIISAQLNFRAPQFVFVRPDVRPIRRRYQRF
jgi:hypothetical protein